MNVKITSITQPLIEGVETPEQLIVYCARVSNPNNQLNVETSDKLLNYCIKNKHWSIFQMVDVCFEIQTSRAIAAQILRHYSFDFQEYCVEGNQEVTTLAKCGRSSKIKIKDLYKRFCNKQYWNMSSQLVRAYDETTQKLVPVPIKEVFKTGLKEVYKLTLECGKTLTCTKDHKLLTRNGFKRLSEVSIEDDFIATNGVPLYQDTVAFKKVKSIEFVGEEETYDIEVEHDSHNYVCGGIITHNSQRYSKVQAIEDFELRMQGKTNRQVGDEPLDDKELRDEIHEHLFKTQDLYNKMVDKGIAKESARFVMPLATATTMYMKGNIRSWLGYLNVRLTSHCQKEHRLIALDIANILKDRFPMVTKATNNFNDFQGDFM